MVHRVERTPEELVALEEAVVAQQTALRQSVLDTLLRSLQQDLEEGREPRIDVLMLSGGGAKGAFGSAFLRSWQENVAADHPHAFPKFDLVTGISTGALIAPYALIGQPPRLREAEDIYRQAKPEWVGLSLWDTITGGKALANTDKLDEKMRSHFTLELAQEIRDIQDNEHRQVLTGSANLDPA